MSTPLPPVLRVVARVSAAVVLLGSCSTSHSEEASDPAGGKAGASASAGAPTSPSYQRYVALGDSYTAAPYVPSTDLAKGCLRSDGNYPSLVARRLHIKSLVDVSCSAADTTDLVRPQNTFRDATVPPQLDALTPDTDLVTLGIGGNDFALFATVLDTCIRLRSRDPSGTPCTDYLRSQGTDIGDEIERIGRHVAAAVRQVRQRAPRARILLVGYPRIVPREGTCPRRLPLATGDYALAKEFGASLHVALKRAARASNVGFIAMYGASRGHDVCSDDPWVNGQYTDQTRALAFHPFAEEMDAVADRIVDRLG